LAVIAVILAVEAFPAAGQATVDVRKFLKENGLEEYHDRCVRYAAALAERKPETAGQILVESFPPAVPERDRDTWRSITVQVAPHFVKGAEDLELVGYQRLSGKVIALCYMEHGNLGPMVMLFMACRMDGKWYSRYLSFETNGGKMLETLKGITRFSGDTVSPLKGVKGRLTMR
jgi:hypothetical protein